MLLARWWPMWIDAARIAEPPAPPPPPAVASEYRPGEEKLTVTWAVACGLIGPVLASDWPAAAPARRIASDSAWVAWFVMMKSIRAGADR